MRVGLEAMGDFPLEPLVAGAIAAARADNHLRITFVGPEHAIAPRLHGLGKVANRFSVVPCSQFITADEDATHALRIKPDSSIVRLWQLLIERKVEAIVTHSAPHTVLAAGIRYPRLLRGVRRPAIASIMPTRTRENLLLSSGGTSADHLYQGGVMAWLAAQQLFQKEAPTIGLLAPGPTSQRHAIVDEARRLFQESPYQANFVGHVSAWELSESPVDVVVADELPEPALLKVDTAHANQASILRHTIPFVSPEGQSLHNGSTAERGSGELVQFMRGGLLLGMEGACVLTLGRVEQDLVQDSLNWTTQWFTFGLNDLITQALCHGPLGP